MKRAFDLLVAAGLLSVLALPLGAIALAVRLSSRGPALHWSDRVGQGNQVFRMPKFRTMKLGTPEVATHLLPDPASHLTPIGSFLRTSSLDELPQLYSVLAGHMSLVGPRPALPSQADLNALREAAGVHRLRPGVTGWAQVNGRDDLSVEEKVRFDAAYLERASLGFDLRIMAMTFLAVLRRDGVAH